MYAVIDIESTGLSLVNDRIIELAIIELDSEGRFESEWCSLINPERDTGPGLAVRVHQIYSSDVVDAPTFADVAGQIAALLAGRAVIAHNSKFDLGMIGAEFARLDITVPSVMEICTSDLARDCGFRPWKLESCCEMLGIEREGAHHALADARATWRVAQHLFDFSHKDVRQDIQTHLINENAWPELNFVECDTVMRPMIPCRDSITSSQPIAGIAAGIDEKKHTEQIIPEIAVFSFADEGSESKYLAAVEWVLEDREISTEQQTALDTLRSELQISDEKAQEVHLTFLRGLAGSMWEDGEISKHERFDLNLVGEALGLSEGDIKYSLENPIDLKLVNEDYLLEPGKRVVFTGEMSLPRSDWAYRAKAAGLRVTGSVSGKTDYLVVPFGETGSSKSRKARMLGVRVVSEQRFIRMIAQIE